MFMQERLQMILQLLKENGSVLVKDLSARFGVTEDCIRKDMALLEKNGLLKRTYGGAVEVKRNPHLFDVQKRANTGIEIKQAIAKKALELIREGDTVFLDISTSCAELAKLLAKGDRKLTVVSTMAENIRILGGCSQIRFFCPGGALNQGGDGFSGTATNLALERFRFDLAFFGAAGIDCAENGVYTYDSEDGETKACALRRSGSPYLMAESKKLNQYGNYRYAGLDDWKGLILEESLGQETRSRLKKLGVELL